MILFLMVWSYTCWAFDSMIPNECNQVCGYLNRLLPICKDQLKIPCFSFMSQGLVPQDVRVPAIGPSDAIPHKTKIPEVQQKMSWNPSTKPQLSLLFASES